MNARNKSNVAYKDALKEYRNHFGSYLSIAMMCLTIVILVLVAAYFLPITLILTIPLIIVPFTFALQASVSIVSTNQLNDKTPIGIFFKSFAVYYSPAFFGGYRSIIGLLKAAGAFAVGMSMVLIPITIITISNNPVIKDIIYNNTSVTYDYLYEILMNDNLFAYGLMYSLGLGILLASFMFIHHILAHSMVVVSTLHMVKPLPMSSHKYVFRYIFPHFRKVYLKEYFKGMWWTTLIFTIGFVLGFAFIFLLKNNAYLYNAHILGLAGAFILISPLTPYVFLLLDRIMINHLDDYNNANMKATLSIMNTITSRGGSLSKEEEEAIKKGFDELKERTKVDDVNKDDK